jgi:hypothetical protein
MLGLTLPIFPHRPINRFSISNSVSCGLRMQRRRRRCVYCSREGVYGMGGIFGGVVMRVVDYKKKLRIASPWLVVSVVKILL